MTLKSKLLHQSVLFFLLFAMLIPLAAAGQKSIFLSEETVRQFRIIVYDDNSVIQQTAAKELQTYLKKIFNFGPPISSRKKTLVAGPRFYLGEGFVRDSIFKIDTLPKDAFIKAFRNGNIYLGGKDDLDARSVQEHFLSRAERANFSTLFAVYDFLENDLGVHWFFPTRLGEFIPRSSEYIFAEEVLTEKPAFVERTFGKTLYYDVDTIMLWMLRNKVTYLKGPTTYKHIWNKILPPKKFYDSNPAIYAKYDGNRKKVSKNGRPAQLCTSNPKTINLFIRQSQKYLDSHPNQTNFSLSPNDHKEFCQCKSCRAQDTCKVGSLTYGRMSCRIFTFYSLVFDSLSKLYPDLKIGGLAYKEYAMSPKEKILPDNFCLTLAINNFGFGNGNCSSPDTLIALIRSWKIKNGNGFFGFPYGNTWVYPYLRTNEYQRLIHELAENNFDKVKFYFYPDWYNQGLDIWLITKMLWDPDVNVDDLKRIYYFSVFPESYPVINQFHSELLRKGKRLKTCVPGYNLPGAGGTKKMFLEIFDSELLATTATRLKDRLANKKLTVKEAENIRNFLKLISFLQLEREAYSQSVFGKMFSDKKSISDGATKIYRLQNSLVLSNKSKYWNKEKSPSFFIRPVR